MLPLDDRPVTSRFPVRLARLGGWRAELPPRRALGRFLRAGDTALAAAWLGARARGADAAAVTAEGLLFGGLIASRERGPDAVAAVGLETLRSVRRLLGRRPLLVGTTIMRLSITGKDREHTRWWSALHRWCELWPSDRPEDVAERRALEAEIPPGLLDRFLTARRVKHACNLRLVDLVAQGTVDRLLVFQEDCTPQGPHRAEQEELLERARAHGVADRVHVLPGTDEGMMLLLARILLAGARTPVVRVVYGDERRAGLVPAFEDRPVRDTVSLQLAAVGARQAGPREPADLTLFVHPPLAEGADHLGALRHHGPPPPPAHTDEALATALGRLRPAREPVAVADLGFCNGADPALVGALAEAWQALAAYAGWNTAANSLGTALGWGLVRALLGGDDDLQRALLAERLADDWLYQVEVRPQLMRWIETRGWDPWNLGAPGRHAAASRRLAGLLGERWRATLGRGPGSRALRAARLPWPRTFECEVEVEPA